MTATDRPGAGMLDAAREYAARGWPVFALGGTKRPVANCRACASIGADPGHDRDTCGCLTCHGFYAATTDPDRIAAMLAAVPRGLLAIRTGARQAGGAGLVCLDIDPRHGGAVDPALMPATATVATGGGGWHLLYTHPATTHPAIPPGGVMRVASRPMPGRSGVDIKADGGYVVAPPSTHPLTGRPYRAVGGRQVTEMHPALIDVCLTPAAPSSAVLDAATAPAAARAAPHSARPPGGCISAPDALLAAHLAAVARAPEGRRRRTLYGAARGVARMVTAGALTQDRAWDALTAAGLAAGQTPAQIRNAIVGAFSAEATPLSPDARPVTATTRKAG